MELILLVLLLTSGLQQRGAGKGVGGGDCPWLHVLNSWSHVRVLEGFDEAMHFEPLAQLQQVRIKRGGKFKEWDNPKGKEAEREGGVKGQKKKKG